MEVRPLIEINGANEQMYGRIAELTIPMFTSVMNVIGTFGSFDRFAIVSQKGYHGCVERNLSSHSTFWTTEYPGQFHLQDLFQQEAALFESHWQSPVDSAASSTGHKKPQYALAGYSILHSVVRGDQLEVSWNLEG